MSKVAVNESSLSGIGDAIRVKAFTSRKYKPSEMEQAILDIPTSLYDYTIPLSSGPYVNEGINFIKVVPNQNLTFNHIEGDHIVSTSFTAVEPKYVGGPFSNKIPYQSQYGLDNIIDGDLSTYFWSNSSKSVGDYIGVDFTFQFVDKVKITAPDGDGLCTANVDVSSNGGLTWTTIGTFSGNNTSEYLVGRQIDSVRVIITQPLGTWWKLSEIDIGKPIVPVMEGYQYSVRFTPASAFPGSQQYEVLQDNYGKTYRIVASL